MLYRRLFDLPTWQARDPFQELERVRRQMDNLYSRLGDGAFRPGAGVFPALNLTEDKDHYYVRAELPGVKSEDLDIQVTAKNLSITGERKPLDGDAPRKYHRREREYGRFSRIIGLPGDVDADKVSAALTDGILTITVPKAEAAKPRTITVS